MRHKVLTPCRFYRRLECQHQHPRQSHTSCQLIRGKSLTKTHLSIPQKFRYSHRLISQSLFKIVCRLLHCTILLWTHLEILRSILYIGTTHAQCQYSSLYVRLRASKPLVRSIKWIQTSKISTFQHSMHIFISKTRAIIRHSRLHQHNFILHLARMQLLINTLPCCTVGITNLQITTMRIHTYQSIGIYGRRNLWSLWKKIILLFHKLLLHWFNH